MLSRITNRRHRHHHHRRWLDPNFRWMEVRRNSVIEKNTGIGVIWIDWKAEMGVNMNWVPLVWLDYFNCLWYTRIRYTKKHMQNAFCNNFECGEIWMYEAISFIPIAISIWIFVIIHTASAFVSAITTIIDDSKINL